MIRGLLSADAIAGLRRELDVESVRVREIGHRIANANNDRTASFEGALDEAMAEDEIDVETEMVNLADARIRYEAASQLLQETYAQIRATMRSS